MSLIVTESLLLPCRLIRVCWLLNSPVIVSRLFFFFFFARSSETSVDICLWTEPGFQCWSGDKDHYDGSDSRRIIHGGKGVENQGDGYKVPPALNFEFHSSKSCPLCMSSDSNDDTDVCFMRIF